MDKQASTISSLIHNRSCVHVHNTSSERSHLAYNPAKGTQKWKFRSNGNKVDNQGSMHLVKNLEYHMRTKHIDIQHHFIREAIEMKKVELMYCLMNGMVADVLTKVLVKVKHEYFCKGMNLL